MRSLAWIQARSCSSKKFYKDREAAMRVAKLRAMAVRFPIYVYPCRTCRGFHLTKQNPEVRK